MIIIGELINASRKSIHQAIIDHDGHTIETLAQDQAQAGATYIDVNAGVFLKQEPEHLQWLVETVQAAGEIPCALDSPNPKAIEAALSVHRGVALINSISLEKERFETLMPIIAGSDCKVIALCMSDEGIPQSADDRLRIADKLMNAFMQQHLAVENIFIDPLVQPIGVNSSFGWEILETIAQLRSRFPGVHTVCGLSNISYGLPARKFLNQTFMVMAIAKGLDSAILNPLDDQMMARIIAAEALAGRDDYCVNYLKAYRSGRIAG